MDRSEDALINIKGIEGYKMLLPEKEFQIIEESDSEDDDDEFEETSSELDFGLGVVLYTFCIFCCTFMIFEKERLHI